MFVMIFVCNIVHSLHWCHTSVVASGSSLRTSQPLITASMPLVRGIRWWIPITKDRQCGKRFHGRMSSWYSCISVHILSLLTSPRLTTTHLLISPDCLLSLVNELMNVFVSFLPTFVEHQRNICGPRLTGTLFHCVLNSYGRYRMWN